jgi:citrate lyase subunit beta/citryl-CoA lyase
VSAKEDVPAVRLTWLYVPGDQPDRFEKAVRSDTDAVIIDLEDAVAAEHKSVARRNARDFLGSSPSKPVFVRINAPRSDWCTDDLDTLGDCQGLSGVRIPKVETSDDVLSVAERLRSAPGAELHCLIESARGVEAAFEIATAHAAVAGISLGEADLRSDLNVVDDEGLAWPRSRVVVAARAAGLPPPPMSVYPDVRDLDGLAASCARGRTLGFLGRSAIHPTQLPVIVAAFMPRAEEIAAASEVLDLMRTALAAGRAAAVLANGRFVDAAMVTAAKRVVALGQRKT